MHSSVDTLSTSEIDVRLMVGMQVHGICLILQKKSLRGKLDTDGSL
jgi:hypothetical protein